ncbi:MAG: hypothetical protein JW856_04470 [Dehalococcoidales bacterium]|nr:hypothetical protein [Dehalococcoidales bacterium]
MNTDRVNFIKCRKTLVEEGIMKRAMRVMSFLVMCIILVMSLMVTGCKELTAEEIVANYMMAQSGITSYRADYTLTYDIEVSEAEEETMNMSMYGTGTTVTDVKDKKLQMTMDMNIEVPDEETQQASVEMYLVDGWLYTKVEIPDAYEQWSKAKGSDDFAEDDAARIIELVESATESTLQGTEKLNGINCYILEIVPDISKMWDWLMSQMGSELTGSFDISQFDLSKIIESISCKVWVSKSGYRMVKTEVTLVMKIDAEAMGVPSEDEDSGSVAMSMSMSMTFYDYNEPVDINLPEEAFGAEEVSP